VCIDKKVGAPDGETDTAYVHDDTIERDIMLGGVVEEQRARVEGAAPD
jgi:hypothetical protein